MTYYARRIYKLAMSSPKVNIFNEDELEVYMRRKAVELKLDPDVIVEEAAQYQPTLDDLNDATVLEELQ